MFPSIKMKSIFFEVKPYKMSRQKDRIRYLAYQIETTFNVKDRFIGLNIDNSPNWVIAFWGILMSGNKPYLINLRHPKELTKSILNTLNVEYLVSDENLDDLVALIKKS